METKNLEQLTHKIYEEGVQKANQEAEKILNEAREEKESILAAAREEADQITKKAEKDAGLVRRTAESEVVLKGKQLVSDLKKEITGLLADEILAKNIKASLVDQMFLQDMILKVIDHWKKQEGIELLLPENLRDQLQESFEKSIREKADGLTLTFDNRISGGFRIARKEDTFQISFTDDDFIALFRSYLDEKTGQLLFNENA